MTSSASATRRYLALSLPWLSAERAIRADAAPPDAAFALCEAYGGANRVVAISAAAADLGILGLTLADARARAPSLVTVPHDQVADAALLDWISEGCNRYSPTVAVVPPQGIVIDITGCLVDYASESALAADLVIRLARTGVTAVWAVATTPDAALALARYNVAEVADLPVAAIGVDVEAHAALRRSGLMTVGQLAARPQAPLAERFGAKVPTFVARVVGDEDVRIVPQQSPPAVVADQRLAEPVVDTAAVQSILDRLIAEVTASLAGKGLGGRRFELSLFRCDGHVARLEISTDRPTRMPQAVALLFRERIGSLTDPLDPGYGYDLVRLAVPVVTTLDEEQLSFDRCGASTTELGLLLDRLTTRLGPERVRRLVSSDSYLPERASVDSSLGHATTQWRTPGAAEPPIHPLHLFTPPHPIDVLAEVPDGPPRLFTWRQQRHSIVRSEGPERIAPEWWRRRDMAGTTRDYYRLEDSDGRRFWVFRHGLFEVEQVHPTWFLHGLFA